LRVEGEGDDTIGAFSYYDESCCSMVIFEYNISSKLIVQVVLFE